MPRPEFWTKNVHTIYFYFCLVIHASCLNIVCISQTLLNWLTPPGGANNVPTQMPNCWQGLPWQNKPSGHLAILSCIKGNPTWPDGPLHCVIPPLAYWKHRHGSIASHNLHSSVFLNILKGSIKWRKDLVNHWWTFINILYHQTDCSLDIV